MPPHLVGARGYFTEASYGPVQGVELLYSDGTATKWGDCASSARRSRTVPLERGEHIVGIDFETEDADAYYEEDSCGFHSDSENSSSGESSSSGGSSSGGSSSGGSGRGDQEKKRPGSLSLYTSHWGGRAVTFQHNGEPQGHDGLGPYVGLNDDECLTRAGEDFTCKRGMRVTGVIFEDGAITGMVQEKIPKGENERWWEKHVDYRPWEGLKFKLDPGADRRYLAGVRAYYTESHRYNDDGYVTGIEFLYSDGKHSRFGDCTSKKVSETIPLQKDEHIVGMDDESGFCPDSATDCVTFYTSHPDGREITFWTAEWDNCSEDLRSKWCDVGLNKGGKKFVCKRGYRVAGISFNEDGAIVKMK